MRINYSGNLYIHSNINHTFEKYIYRESSYYKKNYIFKNILDSRLYQSISFTFHLKPLRKIFFTIFTVGLKQKVKILLGKNWCER